MMNSERLAIQLMILQAVMFAAETVIIHQIGSQASVMQLALVPASAACCSPLCLPGVWASESCAPVNWGCSFCEAAYRPCISWS
jgi:hypothetical protein